MIATTGVNATTFLGCPWPDIQETTPIKSPGPKISGVVPGIATSLKHFTLPLWIIKNLSFAEVPSTRIYELCLKLTNES